MTRCFLERARYYLLHGDGRSFIAQRQWDLSDDQEKRMLLASVIDRVVILPLEAGQDHPGRGGREISIEWTQEPKEVEPPPVNRHTRGTGRARALAREQLEEIEASKAARAARSSRYYEEWARIRLGDEEPWAPEPSR